MILRIFKDSVLIEVKQFDQSQIVFGRPGSEVDIFLEEDSVSPIHCLIEKRENEYYICDLGSSSGTILNQSSVLDQKIETGDVIHIGPFRIEFFVGAPKPKAAPPLAPNLIEKSVVPVAYAPPVSDKLVTSPLVPEASGASSVESTSRKIDTTQEGFVVPKLPDLEVSTNPLGGVDNESGELASPSSSSIETTPSKETPSEPKTVVINSSAISNSRGIKKKATFAKKSDIADLKTYLKPSSGASVQVVVGWHERVLNTYTFDHNKSLVFVGPGKKFDLSLPGDLSSRSFAFIRRIGEELDVLVPVGTQVSLVTSSAYFTSDELQKVNRIQSAQAGNMVRLQNNEILCLKFENTNIEIYVRRTGDSLPIRPIGFIDASATEITGLVLSFVIVALVALYMSVYSPEIEEELNTEEVRLAQFIYTKPPTPPPPPPPVEEEKIQEPPPAPPPPPPPPPKVPPKKIQVTESKPPSKPVEAVKAPAKVPVKASGTASAVRPSPSKVVKPVKQTSVKQGGSVKLGNTAGANAASKEKDVSQTGLLSAFGGGGNRSKLDKAYSGSGELLGAASQASGFSGQNSDRAGEDLGSRFKDDGAGGKGIATQGIANLVTKGRGSGNTAYGAVGEGDGKGRVTIDVPGTNAEFVGSIDREAVRRVIRSILSQIRSCYEKRLRLNPTLGGKIVITFEIAEQGRVTASNPKSNTLADPEVGSCVAARIKAQRFPEPPAGTIAVVDYPFVFDSQK